MIAARRISGRPVPGVVLVFRFWILFPMKLRFVRTRYIPARLERLILDNLLGQIVDDNWTVKVDNRRFTAIFLFHEVLPFLGIETLGILS